MAAHPAGVLMAARRPIRWLRRHLEWVLVPIMLAAAFWAVELLWTTR